jgi:hypothetical protein
MGTASLNQGMPKLSEGQAKALALKLESFWSELSPAEQAHVNLALSRLADDTSDVTGHGLTEYSAFLLMVLQLILIP